MKIRVLGAYGAEGLGQRPTSFLLNDRILIDAGTVGGALSLPEHAPIEHALITHPHLDHVIGLAFLTETLAFSETRVPLTVASLEPVVNGLRTGVFNNVAWPDFAQIPAEAPVMKYRTLVEDAEQRVGDTGPTQALWKAARGLRGLRGVFLECAFPNRMAKLAAVAGHLTPELVRRELDKLPPDIQVWIYHVKPQFYDEI